MDSHTGFGGIVETSSSYFQQKRYSMYTQQVGYGSVQLIPEKMRLEMLVGMQIEILNGREILV